MQQDVARLEEQQGPVLDFGAMMSVDLEVTLPLSARIETPFRCCSEECASFRVCIISAMSVSDLP